MIEMKQRDEGTEGVPVMCEPNVISNLSSKSSIFMLSVGPLSLSGFKRIHMLLLHG